MFTLTELIVNRLPQQKVTFASWRHSLTASHQKTIKSIDLQVGTQRGSSNHPYLHNIVGCKNLLIVTETVGVE